MLRQNRHQSRLQTTSIAVIVLIILFYWRPLSRQSTPLGSSAGRQAKVLTRGWTLTEATNAEREGITQWVKPPQLRKVVGLVFYGRPETVSVLECYLRRNLVSHGGILDEVVFLARTKDQEALKYLDVLVANEPLYSRREVRTLGRQYASAYDGLDDDVMYIKIDDDVVFIEDSTLPTIVKEKWDHPGYFLVGANVVNQMFLAWVHQHLGAIKPYFPEYTEAFARAVANSTQRNVTAEEEKGWKKVESTNKIHGNVAAGLNQAAIMDASPSNNSNSAIDWRASSLPLWEGPAGLDIPSEIPTLPPHRWLPLPPGSLLDNTSIMQAEYGAFARALFRWDIGAQQHYSFLEHLERNELWRYKFRSWDNQGERLSINFIAIMGRDINLAKPFAEDDEGHLTQTVPAKLGRRAMIDGRGMAVHYSFAYQKDGMDTTDVLARYRTFAQENICLRPMVEVT